MNRREANMKTQKGDKNNRQTDQEERDRGRCQKQREVERATSGGRDSMSDAFQIF